MKTLIAPAFLLILAARAIFGQATAPPQSLQAFLATEATNRQSIAAAIQGHPIPAPVLAANLQAMQDLYFGYVNAHSSYEQYFMYQQIEQEVDMLAAPRTNAYLGLTTAVLSVNNGGTMYSAASPGDLLTIADCSGYGYGGVVQVQSVNSMTGAIMTFNVVNPGTGYSACTTGTGATTTTNSASGSGATFYISQRARILSPCPGSGRR